MYVEYLVQEPAGKTEADSLQSGSSPLGLSLRCYRNNGGVCFGLIFVNGGGGFFPPLF